MSDPARRGGTRWWATKVRQFEAHVRARVEPAERHALAAWAPPWVLALFDAMHPADRRHGLDVVRSLREDGVDPHTDADRELLVAGLLHDAGKGRTGVWPRVAFSLGEAYGPGVRRLVRSLPLRSWRASLDRLDRHAETSAAMVAAAGGSARIVELIRHQDAPVDPVDGERLRLADEAN